MTIKKEIFLLLTCLIGLISFSQNNIEFIENKGQWDPQVKYLGKVNAGAFFVHQDGFTVVQHDVNEWGKLHDYKHTAAETKDKKLPAFTLHSHAYNVKFLGGNKSPKIIADKIITSYNNYFIGNDPSKWASNCKIYQGITIKEVYPNIDLRYYSDKGQMKYDLIVNPGGNPNEIALKYDGADKLEVKSRRLKIKTSVGDLQELEPYSYQYKSSGRSDVDVKYELKGNVLRFNVPAYDPKSTLIIDPTIVFCSFTGSTADNWGFSATYGPDGAMFGGGIVFGSGYPTSMGAYQTTFGGGTANSFGSPFDIGIMKLSSDGANLIYSTYIGGSGNEMPQSLIADPQGNLIIAGRSDSPNYPTTTASLGPTGAFDIVVTKLNATGTSLVGSLKIGGTLDDGANISPYGGGVKSLQQNYGDEARSEVNIDATGNVILASCTQSKDFYTKSPFQAANKGGQDGVVIKMTPTLSNVIFSSYFGGSGNDAAYVVSLHPVTGDIYIGGGTESGDLPGNTNNTISSSNHGNVDGFVSIIGASGSGVSKTTYIGTSGIDQVYGVQFDNNGFPYIMGQTTGSYPVINATWSQPNGRQFISKLEPDLSAYVYSTVFGKGLSAPDLSPVAFLVDRCENVYISGWGGKVGGNSYPNEGVQGLTATADAFKTAPDVDQGGYGQDFYFFVLKKNATAQLFGSFFGQNGGLPDHVDGGTSRFSKDGTIYQAICANCYGGGTFPTTAGAWATVNPSGKCNLAMVKISFMLDGVQGGIRPSVKGQVRQAAGCLPLTVDFTDTIQVAQSYVWNFGDGTPDTASVPPTVSHTFTSAGTFTVTMVAIDPTKCVTRDTSYTLITVSDIIADLDFNITKLNPCEAFSYQFDNLSSVRNTGTFGPTSFTWDFGDKSPRVTTGKGSVTHSYAQPGTYLVKLILNDKTFCNSPDSVVKTLRVASTVKADFETPPTGCAPYNAQFSNISQGGATFTWDFGDGGTSTSAVPSHIYVSPGTYTITLTAVDPATCNITDTKQSSITVYSNPVADFDPTPQPPIVNTPISFTNLSSADAVRFKWKFGDGDSLITTSRNVVKHEYNKQGTYNACLTAYNAAGCESRICKDVATLVEAAVDVPNAFTPLSGDVNSKIFVRGYGIGKMKFTVWARWGEKVFETDNKSVGWDGRFKGQLLPMDAYAYTLDVEFTDGTKTRKKGDITLIR